MRAGAFRGENSARWNLALFVAVGALGLCSCGPAAPPRTTYVLGTPAAPVERTEPVFGRPAIEVKRVMMPDYLDGSDILVRAAGNALRPSPTGRWGERLSVGTTRAVAEGLRERLPDFVITTTAPNVAHSCELLMDFDSFEQYVDQPVLLIAEWRVLGPTSRQALAGERTSITEAVNGSGDSAVVAAMSRALENLAARIAAKLQPLGPSCGVKQTTHLDSGLHLATGTSATRQFASVDVGSSHRFSVEAHRWAFTGYPGAPSELPASSADP